MLCRWWDVLPMRERGVTIAICLAFMCVDEFSFFLSIHSVVLNVFYRLTEILFNFFLSLSAHSLCLFSRAMWLLFFVRRAEDDDEEECSKCRRLFLYVFLCFSSFIKIQKLKRHEGEEEKNEWKIVWIHHSRQHTNETWMNIIQI